MRFSVRVGVGFTWVIAASLMVGGCSSGGDGLPREPISGTVTLDGAPLAQGNIAFTPADPSTGSGVGAVVVGGAYEVPRAQGPVPGSYVVSISSTEEVQAKASAKPAQPGDGDAPLIRERIPAKYNAQTTLKAEVTKGGKNVFDFPLSSK
jgi:hypothetical protein